MRVATPAILACLLITPVLPALAQDETAPQVLTVLDRQFVVAVLDESGEYVLEETTTVPLIPETACYGWSLLLDDAVETVEVDEVLQLPAPAETWVVSEDAEVSPDRASSTVTRTMLVSENGWIGQYWCVAEGDPEGPYSITVTADGGLEETFKFEVVRP